MELERLKRWRPSLQFMPTKNDFLFLGKGGQYTHYDRVALIVKWRDTAEKVALNAILIMMVGDLK